MIVLEPVSFIFEAAVRLVPRIVTVLSASPHPVPSTVSWIWVIVTRLDELVLVVVFVVVLPSPL